MDAQILNSCFKYGLENSSSFSIKEIYPHKDYLLILNDLRKLEKLFVVKYEQIEIKIDVRLKLCFVY